MTLEEARAELTCILNHEGEYMDYLAESEVEAIKTLAEERHGEWIEKEDYNMDTYYDCSICGNSWCTMDGTPWQNGMNFCPNCGARMKGGDEK